MDNLEFEDYFGHDTEDDFLKWASVQFKEHRNVVVDDVSKIVYQFIVLYSDGCCDYCYSEGVRVLLSYKDISIVFGGYYSYDDDCKLVLDSVDIVK